MSDDKPTPPELKPRSGALGIIDFTLPITSAEFELRYYDTAFQGLSFLEIFLDRVSKVPGIDNLVAVVHSEVEGRVMPYLSRYSSIKALAVPAMGAAIRYLNHPCLTKSIKWCHQSFRGGALDATIYDDVMPMELLRDLSGQVYPKSLIYFTPEFPLFDVEYATQLLDNREDDKHQLLLKVRASVLGASPAVIPWAGLKLLQTARWTPLANFRPNPGGDGAMIMRDSVYHDRDTDLKRGSLILRSRRDGRRLTQLLRYLGANKLEWTTRNLVAGLQTEAVALEDLPREVDVELNSLGYTASCKLPSLREGPEMDFALFEKLYVEVCSWEDGLLTIGDLGDVLKYSRLGDLRQLVKGKRPWGLHMIWNAETLLEMSPLPLEWMEIPFDILTLRVTPLSYSRKYKMIDIEPVILELSRIYNKSDYQAPVLHIEMNKHEANWRDAKPIFDWASKYCTSFNLVGFNDYAGQIQSEPGTFHYVPRPRYPCEKLLYQMYVLPDGTVPLCKQDFKGSMAFGNVRDRTLKEIWNDEKLLSLRTRQLAGEFHTTELCGRCKVGWAHT